MAAAINNRRLTVVLAGAVTVVIVSAALLQAASEKRIRPLTHAEMAQPWVGLSADENYIFQIDLALDGSGRGAYVFAEGPPHLFHINSWKYDGKSVEITAVCPDWGGQADQSIRGTVRGSRMELLVTGRDWTIRLQMRRRADLEPRFEKLRHAIADSHS